MVPSIWQILHEGLWQYMSWCLKSPPPRHTSDPYGDWNIPLRTLPVGSSFQSYSGFTIMAMNRLHYLYTDMDLEVLLKYSENECPFSLWKIHFSFHVMEKPFKDDKCSREIHTAERSPANISGLELGLHKLQPMCSGPFASNDKNKQPDENGNSLHTEYLSKYLKIWLAKFLQIYLSVLCPKSYGNIGHKSNTEYLRRPNGAQCWYFSLALKRENENQKEKEASACIGQGVESSR